MNVEPTPKRETAARIAIWLAVAVAYFVAVGTLGDALTSSAIDQFIAGQVFLIATLVIAWGALSIASLLCRPLDRRDEARVSAARKEYLDTLLDGLATEAKKYEAKRQEFLAGRYGSD